MDEDSPQFDALLGGASQLPRSLTLQKFVSFRSQEVQIMKNSLSAQSGTKLAFQTLPKHMRRRAMSHNVKRLPRRLRQIHLKQMTKSGGVPVKQKTPSRKYRRRPKNLLVEYTRRSSRKKWLQTHIWHAKRFHMVEKWGYRLACHPRDKAFRANYRAVARHCLIQDISYVKCIEISGGKSVIVEKFKEMFLGASGLSVNAKAFASGNREGEIFLYEFGSECGRAIGGVSFHWIAGSDDEKSKLWIWAHAAYYKDVLENLRLAFGSAGSVEVLELEEDLARFRLTGPLSNSILHDAFILAENTEKIEFLHNFEVVQKQNELWKEMGKVNCASGLSSNLITGLVVQDPRYNLPKKRTKSLPEAQNNCYVFDKVLEPWLALTPLENGETRQKLNKTRITNAEIAEMRSKLLVPGSQLLQGSSFIPILLIQRPGTRNVGLGSGWDVILPQNWSKAFWNACVLRGARVGGLRESNSIRFEMGSVGVLQPDTKAGRDNELEECEKCRVRYFKLPPNKRCNFNKFRIGSPFLCDWGKLVRDWTGGEGGFSVLRDRSLLESVQEFLCGKSGRLVRLPGNCLIPVRLVCDLKGLFKSFAIICIPDKNDVFGRKNSKKMITEPICADKYEEERKTLRKNHKTLLKRLRKRRKLKLKQNEKDLETVSQFTEKIRKLWLPECENLRNSCCREVFGFVQNGGFSLSLGKSTATGFIVSSALEMLIKLKKRDCVLVRNTDSREYRWAKLSIIQE